MNMKKEYIVGILAVLGAVSSLICSLHQGIGLTHDSGAYLYGAYSYATDGTILDHFGRPMIIYPPLYSFILSFAYFTGIDIFIFAAVVNAITYAALIWVVHLFLQKIFTGSQLFYYLSLAWIAGSTPLFMNSVFMWADLLSILLTMLSLYYFMKYTEQPQAFRFLVLAALLGVLCTLQRIIGVTVLMAEGIYLLVFLEKSLLERIRKAFIFSLMGLLPLGAWILRNKLLGGGVANQYDPAIRGVFTNTWDALEVLTTFVIPAVVPAWLRLFVLAVLLLAVFYYNRQGITWNRYTGIILLFTVVYCGVFILLNTVYYICDFDDRYLSPAYIGVVIFFFRLIEKNVEVFQSRWLIAAVLLWSVYPAVRLGKNFYHWYTYGGGYHSIQWKQEPAILWMKNNLQEDQVYTDNPMPFNLLCRPAFQIPPANPEDAYRFEKFYFVKWKEEHSLHYAEVDEALYRRHFTFTEVKTFKDCTVYLLTKK
jgi:hypothetical protein